MQTLTLTLAANQTVAFDISGTYFEIIDSVGLVSVNFYDASGSRTKDLELQKVLSGFFVKGKFSRFEITESSGSAQSVTVLYGSTEGGTRRSPGTVRVIDQSIEKTRVGKQFFAAPGRAADANYLSVIGLRANGATVALKRVIVSSSSAGVVTLFRGTSPGTSLPVAGNAPNKYLGGAPSQSQTASGVGVQYGLTASEQPGWVALLSVNLSANVSYELPLTTPLVIDGTNTFGCMTNGINRDLGMTLDYEEA